MTHVYFVAPFGLGQKTTVWARVLPLARVLVDRGYDVTILIPPWDTPEDSGKAWTDGGVQIVNVKLGGGLPLVLWRLLREIRVRELDIVHIVKPRAHAGLVQWWLWQMRKLTRQQRFKLLLDIDDWEQAWAEINDYGPITSRFLAWQEEWGIRHADGITAASRWLTDHAQGYAPDTPVLYLPNGVVEDVVDPIKSAEKSENMKTILFFSRMIETSATWLAQFVGALGNEMTQVRLVVAGGGLNSARDQWFRTEFDTQYAQLRNSDRVTIEWLGLVPKEDIAKLYAQADCAIFPAEDVPLHQAKCSVRLATTLLNGVPVVASAVGQQQEYGAGGAAILIDHHGQINADPAEFGNAVAALLADPTSQQALMQQAQQRLRSEFNWQKLGQSLAAFYETV